MLVLTVRTAVNAQQERDLRAFHITDRISEQAVNFRSVFALEIDCFRLAQFQLGEKGVVLMRELIKFQFIPMSLAE